MGKKGFTLIEIMFGVAIAAFVLCALLLTYIQCMLLNQSSRNMVTAANDAQFVLEQIKALAYTEISSYSVPALSNLPQESIALSRNIGADIATITVNVSWQERQVQKNFVLSTCVAQ